MDANGLQYAILYIDNLIDNERIDSLSIELSKMFKAKDALKTSIPKDSFTILLNFLSGFRQTEEGCEFDTLIQDLLSGNTIFFWMDTINFYPLIHFAKGRGHTEPTTQM